VLVAAAVVILLGGLFAARLLAKDGAIEAPRGMVPGPASVTMADLEVPCWSCPNARDWPLRFRTDLDLLAPLGTGPGNAAEFFVQFEKNRGSRAAEVAAFDARREPPPPEIASVTGAVVPPDDPLLLEAEPWLDQATMRFYPDLLPIDGSDTRVTNLLMMLNMARSWVARGLQAEDPAAGLDDCRRAIRMGRLLRQEDVVLINDLAGLAAIHIGTRGIYALAQREGDLELALVASVVLGEIAPQRLYTAQRIAEVDLKSAMHRNVDGAVALDLGEDRLEMLITMVTSCPDRRFRGEALLGSQVVAWLGTPDQKARMREVLEEVADSDDPIQAPFARRMLAAPPSQAQLEGYLQHD
jgi:hypothetical protein